MKKLAILATAALLGFGSIAATDAEARPRRGGAIAAGVIGGLAAGALIGAATSQAYAAPYGYGSYGYAPYGYGYPATRVVGSYGYAPGYYEEAYVPRRVYRTTRVVRSYDPYYAPRPSVSVGFGAPAYSYWGW